MNLVDYSEDEEQDQTYQEPQRKQFKPSSILVSLDPEVDISHIQRQKEDEKALQLSQLYDFSEKKNNHLTGHVEHYHLNHLAFDEQYHKFQAFGYAMDPNGIIYKFKIQLSNKERERRIIPDKNRKKEVVQLMNQGKDIDVEDIQFGENALMGTSKEFKKKQKDLKNTRHKSGDAATGDYNGPWAGYTSENFKNCELTEEQKDMLNKLEERRKLKIDEQQKEEKNFEPYMDNHVKVPQDFMGRPYTEPPPELRNAEHTCYIPKRCLHTYHGHAKGVQVIRFFPKYGHLMLSGSMDNKIKMWEVNGQRQLARTYHGHTQAIKDICFTNDGKHFLSAGYDKQVLYWDTEYGKVIKSQFKDQTQVVQTFKIKHYPFCVKVNPDQSRQNLFLLGSSNKKIGQYDLNTGHRTQQYDEHLAAVNTITFFNHNRKFVSSSDDKKLFVWEFGIPVVIKHISEPEMHAINATALHPSGQHWAGQQSDNQVVIYDTKNGNFRMNRKKKLKGHVSAGYACQLSFSPDGQFLASGDAEGRVFFWDWKSCKNYRTIQAHDNVVIGVEWHPIDPSRFATCSWDGTIKLWD